MDLTSINMNGARWMTHVKALLASTAQSGSGSPTLERIHFHTTISEVWMAATNKTIATIAHTADSVEASVDDAFSIDTDAARMTLTLVDYVADEGSAGSVMVSLAAIGGNVTIHIHSDSRSATLTTASHKGRAHNIAAGVLKEIRQQDRGSCLIGAELLKTATAPLEGRLTVQHYMGGGLTILSDDGDLFTVIVPIRYGGPSGPSTRGLKTWTKHLEQLTHEPPRKEDL